jgi:pSer/pThr/pTyr-binding forkhead associated (FHA) protein
MSTRIILTGWGGEATGHEFVLADHPLYTIGRSRNCALRLSDDLTVSRQHCLLEVAGNHVSVRDLGSRNGTYVNGVLIGQRDPFEEAETLVETAPRTLQSGDLLSVGQTLFTVDILDAPAAPTSEPELARA